MKDDNTISYKFRLYRFVRSTCTLNLQDRIAERAWMIAEKAAIFFAIVALSAFVVCAGHYVAMAQQAMPA